MLREMSKLETETEGKLSLKEMAQSFENLAHGEYIAAPNFIYLFI